MTKRQLRVVVMGMTPRQRACLILSRRDRLPNEQIADVLCIGVHDVRDAIASALCVAVKAEEKFQCLS